MLIGVLLLVLPALLLPLVLLPRGVRSVLWTYVLLIPLYMYLKAVFAVAHLPGFALQWPTLAKDVLGAVVLVLLPVLAVVSGRELLGEEQRKLLWILVAYGAYWAVSSLVLGHGPGQTVLGVRPYVMFAVLGVLAAAVLFRGLEDWERLARVLLVGSAVIAAIALVQAYVARDFLIHPMMRQLWSGELVAWQTYPGRLRGFFTSANTLGFFMAQGLILCVWTWLRPGSRTMDVLAVPAAAAFLWVLVLTLSRTALLAAGGSCLLLILLVRPRLLPWALAPTLLAAVLLLTLTSYSARFQDLASNPRLLIWGAYTASTLTSPATILVGHGVGTVGRFGAEVARGAPQIAGLGNVGGGQNAVYFVDNFFVRSFYETGLVGLTFYLVVVAVWWRSLRRLWRREAGTGARAFLALPVTLMAFILGISTLSDSLGTYPWNLLFWMCAAGAMAAGAARPGWDGGAGPAAREGAAA